MEIPASAVSYSLFSVHKQHNYYDKEAVPYYAGWQTVKFTVNQINKLSDIQTRLIKEGFTDFNSEFSSSRLEQYRAQVLEKAVEVAKGKAAIMAKAAERKIKRITKVADTEDSDPAFSNYDTHMISEMDLPSAPPPTRELINIPQSIPVSAVVKVVFELK